MLTTIKWELQVEKAFFLPTDEEILRMLRKMETYVNIIKKNGKIIKGIVKTKSTMSNTE